MVDWKPISVKCFDERKLWHKKSIISIIYSKYVYDFKLKINFEILISKNLIKRSNRYKNIQSITLCVL